MIPRFPRREPEPHGDSVIGQADRITAQRHDVGGRVLHTFVAFTEGGQAFATSILALAPPQSMRQAWWEHEPEEYDGA